MLQALIRKGRVEPREVPAPNVTPGCVLIKVVHSCISAGTELSGVQASGRSLVRQALEQPQKVAKALNMIRAEGLRPALARIRGKLEAGSPTGYSAAGVVLAVGEGVTDLRPGDRVAAAGAGYANHAEYVDVPRNLVMRMPDGLDFAQAATVTLGGIAMQGVRRADLALGEFVVVYGVGILGLLTLRMAVLSGARVIAVDLDDRRLELARTMGAELACNPSREDVPAAVSRHTGARMADAAIFCAATGNSKVLSDAFALVRRKGRLVMVGVWGREFDRNDVYAREIDFLISTSYGPGRYDPSYEEGGCDYPYDYVRWTESRNMSEYLRLLASGGLDARPLVSGVFPIEQVESAYAALDAPEKPLIVLLDYGKKVPALEDASAPPVRRVPVTPVRTAAGPIRVAVVGAGSYAMGMHLPNLQALDDLFTIRAICSRTGTRATAAAEQYRAAYASTDYDEILADSDVDLVVLCTRHDLHGEQVLRALGADKHVLVEKPLCLTEEELEAIADFYADGNGPMLAVGFNRRFSPFARDVAEAARERTSPLFAHYRMLAGYLPPEHWTHGPEGGGRIVGEACHVVDLLRSLTGSAVRAVSSAALHPARGRHGGADNRIIVLEYEDGSVADIEYCTLGSTDLPKELLEVHFDDKTLILDNYQSITGHGVKLPARTSPRPDKGQRGMLREIGLALTGKRPGWPIPLDELLETTAVTFAVR